MKFESGERKQVNLNIPKDLLVKFEKFQKLHPYLKLPGVLIESLRMFLDEKLKSSETGSGTIPEKIIEHKSNDTIPMGTIPKNKGRNGMWVIG